MSPLSIKVENPMLGFTLVVSVWILITAQIEYIFHEKKFLKNCLCDEPCNLTCNLTIDLVPALSGPYIWRPQARHSVASAHPNTKSQVE
jgi:hypothetical protein